MKAYRTEYVNGRKVIVVAPSENVARRILAQAFGGCLTGNCYVFEFHRGGNIVFIEYTDKWNQRHFADGSDDIIAYELELLQFDKR